MQANLVQKVWRIEVIRQGRLPRFVSGLFEREITKIQYPELVVT